MNGRRKTKSSFLTLISCHRVTFDSVNNFMTNLMKFPHLDLLPCYRGTIHLSDRLLRLLIIARCKLLECSMQIHLLVVVSDKSKSIASVVHIYQPAKLTKFGLKIRLD